MLAEIETRLRDQVTDLKTVSGAVEFAALKANPPKNRMPAGYVILLSDDAGRNTLVTEVSQQLTERFGVALALGNLRDARGETATKELETFRDTVRSALVGWPPTTAHDPIEYSRGRVIDFREAVVWWQLEFITGRLVRST